MIPTTAWILCRLLSDNKNCNGIVANNDIDQIRHIGSNLYVANTNATNIICSEENLLSKVINHVVPSMLNAVDYLANRDIDDDGLLEQEYNEDWMDTALRILQNENKNENTCYHLTKSYNHGVKSTFDTLQGRRRKMDGLL
jgi:hypothetical protein